MNKTIEQWLNELESPYREQALENTAKSKLQDKHSRKLHALIDAFSWVESPQGYKYWSDLFISL